MRQALNAIYAAFAEGSDDIDELNRELEAPPKPAGARASGLRPTGNVAALMAAARMPQLGAEGVTT